MTTVNISFLLAFIIVGFANPGCSTDRRSSTDSDCGCDAGSDSGGDDTDLPEPDGGEPGWHMEWAVQAGGDEENWFPYDWVWNLVPINDDSVMATGRYVSEGLFGAGSLNETLLPSFGNASDAENTNCFIARYDLGGALLWAKGYGGGGWELGGMGFADVADDSFLSLGAYDSSTWIGIGEEHETYLSASSFTPSGTYSHAISRFRTDDGSLQWSIRASDAQWNSIFYGITSLPDGSFAIAGAFSVGISLSPDTPEETTLTTAGSNDWDALVARFSSDGSLLWAEQLGGSGRDKAWSLVRLTGGTLLVAGTYENTIVLGSGEENETWLECDSEESDGGVDADAGTAHEKTCPFLASYSAEGDLVWAMDPGYSCSLQELFPNVAAAPDGGFAVAGGFVGEAVLDEGGPNETALGPTSEDDFDILVARYNEDGQLQWAKQIAGDTQSPGEVWWSFPGFPISFLDNGELVLAGHYRDGSPVFGAGEPNETILPTCSRNQLFVALYKPDGELEWAIPQIGTDNNNNATSVVTQGQNTFFVGGSFGGTVTFGMSPEDEITMSSKGDSEIFILRFYKTEIPPH